MFVKVEYILVTVDAEKKRTKLSLRSHEILQVLNQEEIDKKGFVQGRQ
jgi:hypothetical protein